MKNEGGRLKTYMEGIPVLYRAAVGKSLSGGGSPRAAIKSKCLSCCNWQREEIKACNVVICPLHSFRPYQK